MKFLVPVDEVMYKAFILFVIYEVSFLYLFANFLESASCVLSCQQIGAEVFLRHNPVRERVSEDIATIPSKCERDQVNPLLPSEPTNFLERNFHADDIL